MSQPAILPDGGVTVPPGEDELPYDDGVPLESHEHVLQAELLAATLELEWVARDDVFVGRNMFIYFSELQVTKNDVRGPDFFVVDGDTTRRARKSWVAWGEHSRLPDLVLELPSDSTRHVDYGEKMHVYCHVMRVPFYVIFDLVDDALAVYRKAGPGQDYEAVPRNEAGRFPVASPPFELGPWQGTFRGIERTWLRWYAADGRVLPTGDEWAAQERARADEECARADGERVRADEERVRADEERVRADRERVRADEERTRATAALERVAALEAQLARLQTNNG